MRQQFDAARTRQQFDDAKSLITVYQNKKTQMAALRARTPSGSQEVQRLDSEVQSLAASINSSYHCKWLMKYEAHPLIRTKCEHRERPAGQGGQDRGRSDPVRDRQGPGVVPRVGQGDREHAPAQSPAETGKGAERCGGGEAVSSGQAWITGRASSRRSNTSGRRKLTLRDPEARTHAPGADWRARYSRNDRRTEPQVRQTRDQDDWEVTSFGRRSPACRGVEPSFRRTRSIGTRPAGVLGFRRVWHAAASARRGLAGSRRRDRRAGTA